MSGAKRLVTLRSPFNSFIGRSFCVVALGVLVAVCAWIMPIGQVSAAGTISGTVYIDYNMNGTRNTNGVSPNYAIDKGMSAVTVTVYDSAGVQRGTAVTSSTPATLGAYSITATGTGPYRIEFTNLPTGYEPSTVGTNNNTTVRFVPDGNSANVDLGVVSAKEYCQANPELVTTCFSGTVAGNSADPVLVSFPFESGTTSTTSSANVDNPTAHALMVPQNQLGSIWGLAYQRRNQKIFAAAFTKRHAGFRNNNQGTPSNDPTGEIFISNTTGATGSLFLNLNTLFGSNIAGNNPHQISNYETDSTAFDAVGKTGLGDIDISEDEQTLYVSNLADRRLYAIPLGSGAPTAPTLASQVQVYNLATLMNPGTGATGCPLDPATTAGEMNRNLRTGALAVKGGRVYVGLTCTAQSTGQSSQLRAFVYELNPAGSGSAVQVVNIALNYPRGCVSNNGTVCAPATWLAWTNNVTALLDFAPWGQKYYPQPWLVDIEFDQNDFLMLGLSDRVGHQTGNDNSGANTGTVEGVSAGETLRMYKTGATWTLESNANDGTNPPTAGAGTNQGPGGGEFYYQDGYQIASNVHSEISLGGLVIVPGYRDIVVSAMDPAPTGSLPNGQNTYRAGGMVWFNNVTGARSRSYQLFGIDAVNTFGKAAGIGDLEAMCDKAPIQVGNRVWNDANSNGIQDSNEVNLPNVAMQLWADTTGNGVPDTQVGTANTDANGNYLFGGPLDTNLVPYTCGSTPGSVNVSVNSSADDAKERTNGNVTINSTDLNMFSNSGGNPSYSHVGVRFNGVSIPAGAIVTSAYIEFNTADSNASSGSQAVTIQAQASVNPATFVASSNNVSSRTPTAQSVTWNPGTWGNNAKVNTPDLQLMVQEVVGLSGWNSGQSMAFILSGSATAAFRTSKSFDAGSSFAPRLVVQYTVPQICNYKITPGTAHEVRVATTNFNTGQPLANFIPTLADADSTANGDSRDSDGIVISGTNVRAAFTTGGSGKNDHTFDFGFRPSAAGTNYSVGNRVWYDTNNNGIIEPAERGIPGVSVSIFLDANGDGIPDTPGSPISTKLSDANGYYRFDSLQANTYLIRINASNFATAAILAGYQNTAGINTADAESYGAVSNAENGVNPAVASTVQANGILSNPITLSGAAEPTNEADVPTTGIYAGQGSLDQFADMTVDFGFFGLSLNGTVWNDGGAGGNYNNGIINAGETRLAAMNVRLYNSSNVEIPVGPDGILGTVDDAPGGMSTNSSGDYNFRCLSQGVYRVVVNPLSGVSSTPTELDPNLNIDNNDNGFPDNTGNFANRFISGLLTLTPGYTGTAGNTVVNNNVASTMDPTVDFGLLFAPTQVKMDKFEAFYKGDNVVLEWTTGGESDNLGFNLYRSSQGGSVLVNPVPIAGSALRTSANLYATGNDYRWIDSGAESGAFYYLEDIDLDGTRTRHGPIYPRIQFSYQADAPASNLLTGLSELGRSDTQKEFVVEPSNSDSNGLSSDESMQNEIAGMKGVKISVRSDDRYQIPFAELANAGFNVNSNPDTWQLFANGVEVPVNIEQKRGGSNYLEVYGRGFDSPYTDKQVYFLVSGYETGKRLDQASERAADAEATVRSFRVTAQRKDRGIYFTSVLNGEKENWFGAPVLNYSNTLQDLDIRDPHQGSSEDAVLKVRLQGLNAVQHYVNIIFNGTQLGTVSFFDKENEEFEYSIPMSSIREGANRVELRATGVGSDVSLVDEISLRYSRQYTARDGKLRFSVPAGQTAQVKGFDDSGIEVFELDTDGYPMGKISVESEKVERTSGFRITAKGSDREFVAYGKQYQASSALNIETNTASRWKSHGKGADLLIIAPSAFRKPADALAERRNSQGISTRVVNVEDIYDEFGYGRKSATAIREFLETAHKSWELKPQYVILFGDSSYDMRNYYGQLDRDLVPTKLFDSSTLETSSDAWFVDFDDDGVEDIAIGRLPAGTLGEAYQMLSKLERYDAQPERKIKTGLLVADRGFQSYSDTLETMLPAEVSAVKLDRSVLADSELRPQIINEINGDAMTVTFNGHGSTSAWVSNNVFRLTDPLSLTNDKLSFFMLMTCLTGYSHNANADTISENLFKSPNGAIAVWSSSGTTYAAEQITMSQAVTAHMYGGGTRIGDLIRKAKYSTEDVDARRTWQLIGDPTTVIK